MVRMATAVGKYWICKRTPQYAAEAMVPSAAAA